MNEYTSFPQYIQLETICRCNAECIMCSVKYANRDNYIMDDSLFNKIVIELSEHIDVIKRITIYGLGEPLLDKDIHDRILKLKNINIKEIAISTNGFLLDDDMIMKLLNTGIDIIDVSIDGFYASTYENIRKGLNRDIVYDNMKRLIKERNHGYDTKIRIRMTLQDSNYKEFDIFKDYWLSLLNDIDSVYGKWLFGWGDIMPLNNLSKNKPKMKMNDRCDYLFNSMYIQCDGNIPVCCVDALCNYPIGNINDDTVQEIWKSDKLNDYRKMGKSLDICKSCNAWDENNIYD